MSDGSAGMRLAKIEAIEQEVQKLEERLSLLKAEVPASPQEKALQQSTASLLKAVISDLRQEQERMRQGRGEDKAIP